MFNADVYGGIGGLQVWLLAQKTLLAPIRFWDSNWDSILRNIENHQKAFRVAFGTG